jgi:hypothetical protein
MNITNYLTECVRHKIPVSFSKYGDGEYYCTLGWKGANCDKDSYTDNLRNGIAQSFKYMVEEAKSAHIGLWENPEHKADWETRVDIPVRWAKYHTILFDHDNDEAKVELYKAIHQSTAKKIIVCNPLLIKSQMLLNADYIITVPFNNWFDQYYADVMNQIIEQIGENEDQRNHQTNHSNHIIITCCGMGAKVLICELYKKYPNGIYLDFGSAMDFVCTKKDSRNRNVSYDYQIELLKDIIPDEWDDPKYDWIYEEAKEKLGVHL